MQQAFKETFAEFRKEWSRLCDHQAKTQLEMAPNFNVFRLLKFERYEIKLHTRLLRELLNPAGSHGQGNRFLRSFMELIVQKLGSDKAKAFARLDDDLCLLVPRHSAPGPTAAACTAASAGGQPCPISRTPSTPRYSEAGLSKIARH